LDAYPLFAPRGLADLGDGAWCVSSACEGTIGVFDGSGNLRKLIRLAISEEDLAKSDPAALLRRQGERTFFEGTRAGIACQSCHLDSASDGCLHHIGQNKPVDVLSVRGIAGTSPYLRDASHWRLRDLHELALIGYRDHHRPVPWDRAAAVAAYMESLPPASHARMSCAYELDRLRAGVTVFFTAKCNVCHTPPALTNLGQHSALSMFPDYYGPEGRGAGTDNFLDTPSLRGLAVSAPYLHDGRAATLRALLTEWNRANRHGNTRDLSAQQIDDLIYFLERL
jgi:cytochrome c peroxidase